MRLRLTITTVMSDIGTEWTLNASLTIFGSYRKCSKRRTLGHSAQATSLLPIEGMTKFAYSPWFRLWQHFGVCCRGEAEGGPRIQS